MGKASQGALAWDMDNDAPHYVSASVVECNAWGTFRLFDKAAGCQEKKVARNL